jgi:hypothetical protein
MKDFNVDENLSSYLYVFHPCFKHMAFMSQQYKPMKNKIVWLPLPPKKVAIIVKCLHLKKSQTIFGVKKEDILQIDKIYKGRWLLEEICEWSMEPWHHE